MKKFFIVLPFLMPVSAIYAQKAPSKKKHSISVKKNVHANRGPIFLKVYPHGNEGCKKQKYDLSKKDTKTITIPERCCWRELRVVEIGKVDKKKRVIGRVTAKEPLCERGKTTVDIREGKKEKGMDVRPLAIKVRVGKNKKETKKEAA